MSDIIYRDIPIRQGAELRDEYQRIRARYLFQAQTTGTSAASAPTFPTELDSTVVDNTITWLNKGVWSSELNPDVNVWLPSFGYARRACVVTPVDPVDLTGYTGSFQIRETVDSESPIYTGSVEFGTRAEGKFSMVIPTADTATFTFTSAAYDLELIKGGEVDFVVRGRAYLTKEVTR